jgi:hypothetical protein
MSRPSSAHVGSCAPRCDDHRPLGDEVARTAIRNVEHLDGKYLLSTSDPDLTTEDVALSYKNLLEAERGFRDLKSTLELRPVFHRLEPGIRAHVLLCSLALLLNRVAERCCGTTWRRIATELARGHTRRKRRSSSSTATSAPSCHHRPPSSGLRSWRGGARPP